MDSLLRQIRDAFNRLFNRQGVSSLMILTLAVSIGVGTTILTVMYAVQMKSFPVAKPADLALLSDPTPEGTSAGDPGVRAFAYRTYHYFHDRHQHSVNVCVSRRGTASLGKSKAEIKSGTLAARTHGPTRQDVAGARYQAQKGTGYGHFTKRHPFCASQFVAAPGFYGDRTHDAGAGNRYQCRFVLGRQRCAAQSAAVPEA